MPQTPFDYWSPFINETPFIISYYWNPLVVSYGQWYCFIISIWFVVVVYGDFFLLWVPFILWVLGRQLKGLAVFFFSRVLWSKESFGDSRGNPLISLDSWYIKNFMHTQKKLYITEAQSTHPSWTWTKLLLSNPCSFDTNSTVGSLRMFLLRFSW